MPTENNICLHWFGSSQKNIYLPKVPQAWRDALDNFRYEEHIAGFDVRVLSGKREETLFKQLDSLISGDPGLLQGEIYLAGPEEAVSITERFFLDKGLPKSRVAVASVK